jgi:hypothetical protein
MSRVFPRSLHRPKGLDRARVVALVTQIGATQAARVLGCAEQTVRYHVERADVPPRRFGQPRRPLDHALLARMAADGVGVNRIRRALGVSMARTLAALRELRATRSEVAT